jgi:hypothetical protein
VKAFDWFDLTDLDVTGRDLKGLAWCETGLRVIYVGAKERARLYKEPPKDGRSESNTGIRDRDSRNGYVLEATGHPAVSTGRLS